MAEDQEETADDGKPEVPESEKNLQRQLGRAREREKELIQRQLETGTTAATVSRLEDAVISLLEREGDEEKVSSLQSRRESDTDMLVSRNKVAEILSEKNLAWGDESLAGARSKWDSGDYTGAILESMQAGGETQSADDVEAEIERRVTERLRGDAKGVDTGASTQSGHRRYTIGDLDSMSVKEMMENEEEIFAQYSSKR
jgi:hypothetical protein